MKVFRYSVGIAVLMAAASYTVAGEEMGQRPHPPHPPEVAYQACEGLSDGDRVEFSQADGHSFHGVCRILDGRLVAMPEHGMRRHEGRMPPPLD